MKVIEAEVQSGSRRDCLSSINKLIKDKGIKKDDILQITTPLFASGYFGIYRYIFTYIEH